MMDIEVKKLAVGDVDDFICLVRVFEEVFEMIDFIMPPRDYLAALLQKDTFSAFVAIADDTIVAGLTAYTLDTYYTKGSYLYIYDLGVMVKYQRQGIGKTLIQGVIDSCKGTSVTEVFVQADMADDDAVSFYRSTGGREENVVGFSYLLL
ncbi:MAG: GNAT family N-acetyltransferase [Chitinophagaceae bacterium]|nr:MAG: GNAT family N-acetyltransferase [Chitinophagaceae bacterium]